MPDHPDASLPETGDLDAPTGGYVLARGGALITHEGHEVGTATSGELTIDFPDETVTMRAGDSITFPFDLPHRSSDGGGVDAVATWLIVH